MQSRAVSAPPANSGALSVKDNPMSRIALRVSLILCRCILALPQKAKPKIRRTSCSSLATTRRGPISGFSTSPAIRTPNLDRLSLQSAVFERGYVPMSLCRPSLATLISGLYPHQHQLMRNEFNDDVNVRFIEQFSRLPTLPRWLADKNYASFQTGKWWEGSYRTAGFTAGMTEGGRHGDGGRRSAARRCSLSSNLSRAAGAAVFRVVCASVAARASRSAAAAARKVHAPGQVARPVRYYATCEWFDETCGELLDFLWSRELDDKTLVVFVTDNGWTNTFPKTPADERNGVSGRRAGLTNWESAPRSCCAGPEELRQAGIRRPSQHRNRPRSCRRPVLCLQPTCRESIC